MCQDSPDNDILIKGLAQEMDDFSDISRIGCYLRINVIIYQDSPSLAVLLLIIKIEEANPVDFKG